MPLWTILAKCPAPAGPACTKPASGIACPDSSTGAGGLRAAQIGWGLVTGTAQPLGHVAAHLAQPDQPQLHGLVLSSGIPCVGPHRASPGCTALKRASWGGSARQPHGHDQVAVGTGTLGGTGGPAVVR